MTHSCLRAPANCDSCSGFGATCQVIESRSLIETAASFQRLRDAITDEAESGLSLAQLIQGDVSARCGTESVPVLLSPAPESVDIFLGEAQDAARPFR